MSGIDSKEVAESLAAYNAGCHANEDCDFHFGDGVVDSLERRGYYGLKSDVNNRDSYSISSHFAGGVYADYGDEEIRCRYIESLSLENRYLQDLDWCFPGSQHNDPYGPIR